jgi:hypothetical protein
MKPTLPAREIRIKSFKEYLAEGASGEAPETSNFRYVATGEPVPADAITVPWGGGDPDKKLKTLRDILGEYAASRGFASMSVGDEV